MVLLRGLLPIYELPPQWALGIHLVILLGIPLLVLIQGFTSLLFLLHSLCLASRLPHQWTDVISPQELNPSTSPTPSSVSNNFFPPRFQVGYFKAFENNLLTFFQQWQQNGTVC